MKKFLIGLGVVLGLLLLAVFLIPTFIPKDALEARIEAAASDAMGRSVTIDGPPDISIFPTALQVRGLLVANAEGFDAPYLLRVDEADIGVKLLPLLSKRVEITRFDLKEPDINLQARPDGAVNWTLPPPEDPDAPLPDVRLGTVNLSGASISYDGGTGKTYAMTDADVTIEAPSLDETLTAEGTMQLEGRPARFDASVTTPRSLAEDQVADLTMSATVGENEVTASGRLGEALTFGGKLDVNAEQLRDLMVLSGADVPEGPGFERLALAGTVSGNPDRVTFAEGTTLAFDGIEGTGNVTIDMTGARPSVSGRFATDRLDLRPYVPSEDAPERDPDAPFPAWSEAPIDFTALQSADADLSFTAGAIVLPTVEVGQSDARLVLKNGRLAMTLNEMALYGGNGTGTLTVNAGSSTPTIAAAFGLQNVGIQGLVADLMGTDRLAGTGIVRVDVSTAGASQAAFVRNLSGDVAAELSDGTIQGVNLGKVARSALAVADQLRAGGLNVANIAASLSAATATAREPGAATDFSELLVDLSVNDGVVTTDALRMTGPYFAVIGEGRADLPNQTVRMTLAPRVSSADGEPLRELIAPILVSGTFSDPKVGVDAGPLAKGVASDKVRGLLGKAGIETEAGGSLEDTVREGARQGLGRLLGGERKAPADDVPADDTSEGSPSEDEEAAAPSGRDALIQQGLGAVFGGRKPSEEKPAEAPEEE